MRIPLQKYGDWKHDCWIANVKNSQFVRRMPPLWAFFNETKNHLQECKQEISVMDAAQKNLRTALQNYASYAHQASTVIEEYKTEDLGANIRIAELTKAYQDVVKHSEDNDRQLRQQFSNAMRTAESRVQQGAEQVHQYIADTIQQASQQASSELADAARRHEASEHRIRQLEDHGQAMSSAMQERERFLEDRVIVSQRKLHDVEHRAQHTTSSLEEARMSLANEVAKLRAQNDDVWRVVAEVQQSDNNRQEAAKKFAKILHSERNDARMKAAMGRQY